MTQLFFKGSRKEVTLPLVVNTISPTGGKHAVHIRGKFRVIDREEQESLKQGLKDGSLSQEDVIRKVLIGWADVKDQDDTEVEYNEENLTAALNNPFYFSAFGDGAGIIVYGKEVMERVKAKNF